MRLIKIFRLFKCHRAEARQPPALRCTPTINQLKNRKFPVPGGINVELLKHEKMKLYDSKKCQQKRDLCDIDIISRKKRRLIKSLNGIFCGKDIGN